MLTVALQNSKGGVGKTTTAKELWYFLIQQGYKVAVLDSDENASLLDFVNERYSKYGDSVENIDVEHYTGGALDAKLQQLENKGFDVCLIDTHGGFTQIEQSVVELVDMIILPVEPETSAIKATVKLVNYLEKEIEKRGDGLPVLALLYVAFRKNSRVAKSSMKEMAKRDLVEFEQHLNDHKAKYQDANQISLTVQECYELLNTKSKREEYAIPAIQLRNFGNEFLNAAIELNLLERK